ncbi:MAG: transcriptional repressor [Chloroflexi bacterium]|nr:transcriptional repressor [Chloroflexota bacterium]
MLQDNLKDIFREYEYKFTPQRKAVVSVLFKNSLPMTVHDIFLKTKEKYADIGLATVYRTLDVLQVASVLGQVKKRYAPAYYLKQRHGFTLTCYSCGQNSPEPPSLAQALEQAEKEMGFRLQNLKVVGLCQDCAHK